MRFFRKHKKRVLIVYVSYLFVYCLINLVLFFNEASNKDYLIYNGLALVAFFVLYAMYRYFSDTFESLAFLIILVGFSMPASIILFRDYLKDKWKIDELGAIGDFIGGSTVSFLTLASILLIVETIRTQRKEMHENRKQFEKQTIQMEKQNYNSEVYFIYNNKINYIQNLRVIVSNNLAEKIKKHREISEIVRTNEIIGADVLELIYYAYDNVIDFTNYNEEIIKIYYKSIPYLFNQNITLFELSLQFYNKNKNELYEISDIRKEYIEYEPGLKGKFKNTKEAKNLILNMDYFERKIMIMIAEQNRNYNDFQKIKEELIILKDRVNYFNESFDKKFLNYKKIIVELNKEKQSGFDELDKLFDKMMTISRKVDLETDRMEKTKYIRKELEYNREIVKNEFYNEWMRNRNNIAQLEIIKNIIDVGKLSKEEKYQLINSALEIKNIKEYFIDTINKIEKLLDLEIGELRNDIKRIPDFYSEVSFDFELIKKIENKINEQLKAIEGTFGFNFLSEEIGKIITLIPNGMKDILSQYDYFGK